MKEIKLSPAQKEFIQFMRTHPFLGFYWHPEGWYYWGNHRGYIAKRTAKSLIKKGLVAAGENNGHQLTQLGHEITI